MKVLSEEKAIELSAKLLQNDKDIRDELKAQDEKLQKQLLLKRV